MTMTITIDNDNDSDNWQWQRKYVTLRHKTTNKSPDMDF